MDNTKFAGIIGGFILGFGALANAQVSGPCQSGLNGLKLVPEVTVQIIQDERPEITVGIIEKILDQANADRTLCTDVEGKYKSPDALMVKEMVIRKYDEKMDQKRKSLRK